VTKWADYSTRFGFCSLLSDGTIHVHFVDGTVLSKRGKKVDFKDPSGNISSISSKVETADPKLSNRLRLLGFFSRYLSEKVASLPLPRRKHVKNVELDTGAFVAWKRDDAFVSIQMQGLVQIENLLSGTRFLLWRSEERLSLTIVSASRVETLRLNSVCELRILGLIQESVLPQVRVLAGIEI